MQPNKETLPSTAACWLASLPSAWGPQPPAPASRGAGRPGGGAALPVRVTAGRCQGVAGATGAAEGRGVCLGLPGSLGGRFPRRRRRPGPRPAVPGRALRAGEGPAPPVEGVSSRHPAPAGGAAGRRPGAALAAAAASLAPAGLWRAAMDRNPSPPSSEAEEEEGDAVGNTVYSKHWLFSILTRLIEVRAWGSGGAVREEAGGRGNGQRLAGAVRPLPGHHTHTHTRHAGFLVAWGFFCAVTEAVGRC